MARIAPLEFHESNCFGAVSGWLPGNIGLVEGGNVRKKGREKGQKEESVVWKRKTHRPRSRGRSFSMTEEEDAKR
jgi:hypothetical protein